MKDEKKVEPHAQKKEPRAPEDYSQVLKLNRERQTSTWFQNHYGPVTPSDLFPFFEPEHLQTLSYAFSLLYVASVWGE